jgi:hypothetical protein
VLVGAVVPQATKTTHSPSIKNVRIKFIWLNPETGADTNYTIEYR